MSIFQHRPVTRSQRAPFQELQSTAHDAANMPAVKRPSSPSNDDVPPESSTSKRLKGDQSMSENASSKLSLKRRRQDQEDQEEMQEQPNNLSRKAPRTGLDSTASSKRNLPTNMKSHPRATGALSRMPTVFTPVSHRPVPNPTAAGGGARRPPGLLSYLVPKHTLNASRNVGQKQPPKLDPDQTTRGVIVRPGPSIPPTSTPASSSQHPPAPPSPPHTINPFLQRGIASQPSKQGTEHPEPASSTQPDTATVTASSEKLPSLAAFIHEAQKDTQKTAQLIIAEGTFDSPAKPSDARGANDMEIDYEAPHNESPSKPSKNASKPSMIPRLVPARPPLPSSTLPALKKRSSFSSLASTSTSASQPPVERRKTMLTAEAQTSLANISMALEKLSIPRPRSSLGGPMSSFSKSLSRPGVLQKSNDDFAVPALPASTETEDEADDRLPPRPNTSLGFASRMSTRSSANVGKAPSGRVSKLVVGGISSMLAGSISKPPPKPPLGKSVSFAATVVKGTSDAIPEVPVSSDDALSSSTSTAAPSVYTAPIEAESDCLKGCTIYVDVRTDEGADAGAMFVTSLRKLGAKVLARWSPSCTHIVWKAGLQSTLSRFSTLNAERESVEAQAQPASDEPPQTDEAPSSSSPPRGPKKLWLMGIGWVVKCVEKKQRVPEELYQLDVAQEETIFGAKRRRSMAAKDRSALTDGLIPGRPNPLVASSSKLKPKSTLNPHITQSASAIHRRPASSLLSRSTSASLAASTSKPKPKLVKPTLASGGTKVQTTLTMTGRGTLATRTTNAGAMFASRVRDNKVPSLRLAPLVPPAALEEVDEDEAEAAAEEEEKNRPSSSSSSTTVVGTDSYLDPVERARKNAKKFAPKISSPLKRNFRIFDDDYESD